VPYVRNGNVRIHYQVEGHGPPLILHHWSLGSLEGWTDYGYVDRLADDYTVIAHDVRGHGESDKPHDPDAYGLESRVNDVVTVLDDLGIERAHFYGYSMGGWIGFGIHKYASERFRSVAIGGAHPFAQNMSGLRSLLSMGVEEGPAAFIDRLYEIDEDFAKRHAAHWREADFLAQRAAACDRSSLEEILPSIDGSCLILAGTEDEAFLDAERACGAIRDGRFKPLRGLDHGAALARSELVVPLLKAFIEEVETRRA